MDTQEVEMSPNFKSFSVVIFWLVGHADDLWSNGCAAQDAACYHCGSGIRTIASGVLGVLAPAYSFGRTGTKVKA